MRLSVVLPVYNEAPVIRAVLEELDREVACELNDSEIIVVDDCSTDGTAEILDEMAKENPRLRIDHSIENRGHGPALRRAIELSSGSWIFHMDSDRQARASEFWDLWNRRQDADLVLGTRVKRQDPKHRVLLSRIVAGVVSLLSRRRIPDANVPFKLFSDGLWMDLRPFIPEDAVAPSVMISMGAAVRGWRIDTVPVTHLRRAHGASWLKFARLLRLSLRGLAEVLAYRWALARARR